MGDRRRPARGTGSACGQLFISCYFSRPRTLYFKTHTPGRRYVYGRRICGNVRVSGPFEKEDEDRDTGRRILPKYLSGYGLGAAVIAELSRVSIRCRRKAIWGSARGFSPAPGPTFLEGSWCWGNRPSPGDGATPTPGDRSPRSSSARATTRSFSPASRKSRSGCSSRRKGYCSRAQRSSGVRTRSLPRRRSGKSLGTIRSRSRRSA